MQLADALSVWELCDIVKDSTFSTIGSSGNPDKEQHAKATSEVASDGDDPDILEDIRTFITQQGKEEDSRTSLTSHLLSGFWEPDGGPGRATNPQLQLRTGHLTLLQVELRAQVPANDALELWLLGGTHWGETVKQLAPDQQEDEAQKSNEAKVNGRFYRILTSAYSVSQRDGPLRVVLECEVEREQTLTLLLARGSYMQDSKEKDEAPMDVEAQEDALTSSLPSLQSLPRPASSGRRMSQTSKPLKSACRMSQDRTSVTSESGPSSGTPVRGRKICQRKESVPKMGRWRSQDSDSGSLNGGRGSIQRQANLCVLPPVALDQCFEPGSKPAILVPDFLIPPETATVRGWSAEDDHFEVRFWSTSPLQKSPKILTESKKPVEFDNSLWRNHVHSVKQTFEHLEEVHEESLWQARADTAWHARVSLNEDLDKVQAELRRLQQADIGYSDFFKYCRSYRRGGFMLLDCIGKELGVRERMSSPKRLAAGSEVT